MSRVNAAGALFEALALACLLESVLLLPAAGRFARAALLAGMIGPFTCTNWFIAKTWAEAYAIEEKILSGISAWLAKLPATHAIVLQDAPSNLSGAEVFSAHWGFDAALRIRSGRKDVRGIVALPTMQTEPRGLVDYAFTPPHVTPYDGMLLYHYPTGQLRRPVPSK